MGVLRGRGTPTFFFSFYVFLSFFLAETVSAQVVAAFLLLVNLFPILMYLSVVMAYNYFINIYSF